MATTWTLVPIVVASYPPRASFEPGGEVTALPQLPPAISHWADLAQAERWRQRALALAARPESFAGDAPGAAALLYAIAQFFNCLNIPWYMHPDSRLVYRQFLAGPPATSAGNTLRAQYLDDRNYSPNWYTANQPVPVGSAFGGIIPARGLELYRRFMGAAAGPAGVRRFKFVPTIGLRLGLPEGAPPDPKVRIEYQRDVVNDLTTFGPDVRHLHARDEVTGFPLTFSLGDDLRGAQCKLAATGADCPGGHDARTALPDAFYYHDDAFVAPYDLYLQWARVWIADLAGRDLKQIILDARAYAIYVNAQQAILMGSAELFAARAIGVSADIFRQQRTADPTVTAVGGAIVAVSGAATVIPVVGPVVGLIGGAVGLGITIFETARTHDASRVFKDDLGRYKPTLERGWLGGNPIDATDSNKPGFLVPEPPAAGPRLALTGLVMAPLGAMLNVRDAAQQAALYAQNYAPQYVPRGAAAGGSLGRTVATVAVCGALAYGLHKLATKGQAR